MEILTHNLNPSIINALESHRGCKEKCLYLDGKHLRIGFYCTDHNVLLTTRSNQFFIREINSINFDCFLNGKKDKFRFGDYLLLIKNEFHFQGELAEVNPSPDDFEV